MKLLAASVAAILLFVVLQDAFEVMLLPRRTARRVRLVRVHFRATWWAWSRAARRMAPGPGREHWLGHYGPLALLLLFGLWMVGLMAGFGLLEWALDGHPHRSLGDALYMSGVTLFTLGYGDVVPHSDAARLSAVLEAGTGLGFLAAVIGYLPVLYQLFSRREAHVILLDGRAGSPPAAATLLARHGEDLPALDAMFREWEVWSAELLESHLSYPMLAYYRSQHDDSSWLAATGCLMDCCALVLVGLGQGSKLQARMTFTMARQVLVELAQALDVAPSRYTGGDRLAEEDYRRMEEGLVAAGLDWRAGEDTRATLAALRATYEPLLDGLASYLLVPVPGWAAEPGSPDHWERGHRGLLAARLVEELAEGRGEMGRAGPGWRGLRDRLRRPVPEKGE